MVDKGLRALETNEIHLAMRPTPKDPLAPKVPAGDARQVVIHVVDVLDTVLYWIRQKNLSSSSGSNGGYS